MLASRASTRLRAVEGPRPFAAIPRPSRSVACHAATTSWDAWTPFMTSRKSLTDANTTEVKICSDIASAISKSAVGYKPHFAKHKEPQAAAVKLQHLDKITIKELPKDLHDRLEAVGVAALEKVLGLGADKPLDYANVSYTTTDIDAALSITGTVLQQGSDRSAVVAFVATETERPASWSRLEGLILHWNASQGKGQPWAGAPEGWTAIPNKTKDAGGAWQCSFEKQTVAGSRDQLYVLVMQLPLRGNFKSGGMAFVCKGTANQTDRWLKDAETDKDFFLDLQKLPITK